MWWTFIGLLISILAFFVFLILGIISLIRRDGKAKKKFISAVISLAVFLRILIKISSQDEDTISTGDASFQSSALLSGKKEGIWEYDAAILPEFLSGKQ